MSEYRNRTTGELYTKSELVDVYKNVSFSGGPWTASALDFMNVDPVLASPQPAIGDYEVVVRDGAVQDDLGNWVQAWKVNPMFVDDEVGTAAEKIATFEANKLQKKRQNMVVTMRQARLALSDAGHLVSIPTLMAAMPEPDKTNFQIEWEYSTTVERLDPWVISMGTALGLTDTDMDNLFDTAITL